MEQDYRYGFDYEERDGRKIIRYRQDKLWFKAGCAWYVFFTLISLFFLLGERWAWQLPVPAFVFLVWWRSRKREISVGEKDLRVGKKVYDRTRISRLFVEHRGDRQNFRAAQNYEEVARRAAQNPLGGDPAMARASAMAADATTSVAMMVASGIDSKGKKVRMEYDGKTVVIASWLSVHRAMILANAVGGLLGYTMDEEKQVMAGEQVWPGASSRPS